MKKTYVGIDIGKNGAIAVLYPDNTFKTFAMPLVNNGDIDYSALNTIVMQLKPLNAYVVFEKLGVIFGTTKSTAFSMGYQAGAIEMSCIANGIEYSKVRAVDWQKEMYKGIKEITKPNSTKRDTKAMALVAIKQLLPELKLTFGTRATKPHDGLVDAVLMALYARRLKNGMIEV